MRSNAFSYALVTSAVVLSGASATAADAKDIKARVQAKPKPHPRLFLTGTTDQSIKDKIRKDPLLSGAMDYVIRGAEEVLKAKPVTRRKQGRRLLTVSRTCLKRVTYLAFAYRMTGEEKYLRRAEQEMVAAAGFSDWNPSHFLDVGEMTAALAVGYDWLYDDLKPEHRATIRKAILDKGLKTSLKGGWWVKTENNWNQVCHGGLTLGALALQEDEPDLAVQIIERAVKNVPRAMKEYEPHGAYPEGPTYWRYGTTYNVVLLAALESALDTDFGLTKSKGFLESSDYFQHAAGPGGLFFNYSDCGLTGGVTPAMYWFAVRRKNPSLLWREKPSLEAWVKDAKASANGDARLFPLLLVWATPFSEVPPPTELHWHADGRTPVSLHRTAWDDPNATFLGIKGGSPSANHAHMDTGCFVLDARGVRWAWDLGAQSYHSLESKGISLWDRSQNGQRWTVFRLGTSCHNVLMVDGRNQVTKSMAPITKFSDTGPMPHTIVDMTTTYKGQLASAIRGAGLRKDGSVVIQDEVTGSSRKATLRWAMMTKATPKVRDNGTLTLHSDGEMLTLRILSPTNVEWEVWDTSQPVRAHDHSNPGTRMVGFNVEVPAKAKQTLVVSFQPGDKPGPPPESKPLKDW